MVGLKATGINMLGSSKLLVSTATLLFFSWLVLILNLRTDYVNLSGVAPLGMVYLLFPAYWLILAGFIATCFFVFRKPDTPRWLHIVLLAQFALMLYYTPFLLGGFSWSPDSLWHAGVADYMPSILSGSSVTLGDYAQSYPLSFMVTYGVESVFSLDVVTYTLYVFPPICIVLISSLAYFFASRISNKKTAFLSMLLALPALHYIEPHVSPFATGTVLLLASLVLLTYKGPKASVLSLLLIVALVLTHPISPLFLGIYLSAAVIVNLFYRKHPAEQVYAVPYINKLSATSPRRNVLRLTLLLLVLGAFWFYWTLYQASPNYLGVQATVSKVFDLTFLTNVASAVQWTAGGQGFLYPQVSQLSLFIYAIFLVSVIAIFAFSFVDFLRHKKHAGQSTSLLLTLTLTAIGSGIMSYLLFASSGERFLLGRGLIVFLLMGAVCVASYFAGSGKSGLIKTTVAFVLVAFLVCTFPVIAYSKEAYNTFTPSAESGLVFLSENIDLSQETLSMTSDQQLAAYADLRENLTLTGFPPDLNKQKPDVIVLRVNSYYFLAMRYNMSLTNNSYTLLCENLTQNPLYDKVYSNSKFDIYRRP
ncbi:MAG: hypothetical protein M1540_08320 [Candidatus Bathyarchaeota archaeon]|nr:hypothetical protein [Candidatus Bathyarchaeota archaeon]